MDIKKDDLTGADVIALIAEHLEGMFASSPPESVHALNLDGLKKPEITFWSVWEQGELLGIGALKELSRQEGEVKSMRTASQHLRKGVARYMLDHIVSEAKSRGYKRLNLETGSMEAFAPAVRLYESFGFKECEPFADYSEDPNSLFMTLEL
ncbi:GNAT family N-acetyltransferase [Paenibacillus ferrarius]|uniref:GNAT family N-acetyltransferase n=1 Tax=Paenibacillus ferrarius TaxID=1469647 RepID=UPI003D2B312B